MQVIKPLTLGVSTRHLEWHRRFGMAVTVSCYFAYDGNGASTLRTDASMWSMLSQEMVLPLIDEGVPKSTSEFLVWGLAFPPEGPAAACAVRMRLGDCEKHLAVSGDRYWDGERISAPRPFESMPLDWRYAYGGTDFPANPLGRGRDADKEGVVWLPNVELPGARLTAKNQVPPPAACGYVAPTWPQRARLRGTYGGNWYQEHSPGLAPDIDWRHFNLAPQDQWLAQPLRGDETFEFEHMHPERPLIEGRLPGLRARCFVQLRGGKRVETPLRPTTVWFLPHLECGIVLYHGMMQTAEEDGSDVEVLMVAAEALDDARSDEHYHEVMNKRRDPEFGGLYALCDGDLVPENLLGKDPDFEATQADYKLHGLHAETQRRKVELEVTRARAKLQAQGLDPDAFGLRMPEREELPPLSQLPEYLKQKLAEAAKAQEAGLAESAKQLAQARANAAALGVDPEAAGHRGPPIFRAADELARIQAQASALGKPVDDLAGLQAKLQQAQTVTRVNYLRTAHAQNPAPRKSGERAQEARAEVVRRVAAGESLAAVDLTGADLSGLDLRGANFSAAHMESVDLSGANVSGANFSMAVLAHADLSRLVAIGTWFMGANLGKATLAGAVFDQARLDGAMIMQTAFQDLSLREATLHGVQWFESTFSPADWSGAIGDQLTFYRADLKGMVWENVQMRKATFIECEMENIDLCGADLSEASFIACKASGARCVGTMFERAAFVQGCDFSAAVLTGARLSHANLRGVALAGCDLSGATLQGADLSEADLNGARLARADLRRALLIKSDLRAGLAPGVNLMEAVMQRAALGGTDLRGANLYSADLSRVVVDETSLFEGVVADRARLYPRADPNAPLAGDEA